MPLLKSKQYRILEREGIKLGYSGKKLQRYIKGRVIGRIGRAGKAVKKAKPKKAIVGKVAAMKLLKIDAKIEPLLHEVEEKIHSELEEEERELVRSRRISELIPRIEREVKMVDQFNVYLIELYELMEEEEEKGISIARRMTNKVLGSEEAQSIAKKIRVLENDIAKLVVHIDEELRFIENTIKKLRRYDVAEKVDHKQLMKWVDKVRDEIEFAKPYILVEHEAAA